MSYISYIRSTVYMVSRLRFGVRVIFSTFKVHPIISIDCINMFAGIEKAKVLSTGESEDDHQAKECL